MDNRWKIDGQLIENRWKIDEKSKENRWKIDGKSIANQWKIDGKSIDRYSFIKGHMNELLGSPAISMFMTHAHGHMAT